MESLSEVKSRLPEGSVKRVLFDALEEAGSAGLNVASLVDAVQVFCPLHVTHLRLTHTQNFTFHMHAPLL